MRLESFLIGLAITAFGVVLVATHGVIAGVNIPALAGLSSSCSTSAPSSNGTGNPGFCPGAFGYSVGTIVVIFGLGILANGLRSPAPMRFPKGTDGGMGMGMMPPELMASMGLAQRQMQLASAHMAAQSGGPQPGVRYCSNCGRANALEAQFCQKCGRPMNLMPSGTSSPSLASTPPQNSVPPPPPPPPPPPEAPKV